MLAEPAQLSRIDLIKQVQDMGLRLEYERTRRRAAEDKVKTLLLEEAEVIEILAAALGHPAGDPDPVGETPWPNSSTVGDRTILSLADRVARTLPTCADRHIPGPHTVGAHPYSRRSVE